MTDTSFTAANGTTESISHCFSSVTAPAAKDNRHPCKKYKKTIAGPDRQEHRRKHILLSSRGSIEIIESQPEVRVALLLGKSSNVFRARISTVFASLFPTPASLVSGFVGLE
jgi:hypothetical protein